MTISGVEPAPAGLADVEPLGPGEGIAALAPRQLFWRRFRQDKVAMISGIIILVEIAIAILAPVIVKILGVPGPQVQNGNLTNAFGSPLGPASPPLRRRPARPRRARTDHLRRPRLAHGRHRRDGDRDPDRRHGRHARRLLQGRVDTFFSRVIDVVLSIPPLLLALGIAASCSVKACAGGTIQPGVQTVIFLIALIDLALPGEDRAGAGAVLTRARVHRGLPRLRGVERPHHVPRDPARTSRRR